MAYKLNGQTIIQDDNGLFNTTTSWVSNALLDDEDDFTIYYLSLDLSACLNGGTTIKTPLHRVLHETNPLTNYKFGDTNNSGAIDLSDVLDWQKYGLGLKTTPDTLFLINKYIGPAASAGHNQADEDAGGYLVGYSDEDAYRVLELYVNSGTPAWVTEAFTDGGVTAFADIDDNGSINSSDLTAARNVINGTSTNNAHYKNFYIFKGLVCGKFFAADFSNTSAMWGRGLVGTGNGFAYAKPYHDNDAPGFAKTISGTEVSTENLEINIQDPNLSGAAGRTGVTDYGLCGIKGNRAKANYGDNLTTLSVSLPSVSMSEGATVRIDFYFVPINNGAVLYADPQTSSNTQINVDYNYRSSYSSSDVGSYLNNNASGIRLMNYGVRSSSNPFCAGSMYLYNTGGYWQFRSNIAYQYNGGYTMEGIAVGQIRSFDPSKIKFRFNSGNISFGGATAVPVGELLT